MSSQPPPSSQQAGKSGIAHGHTGRTQQPGHGRGDTSKVYLHSVADGDTAKLTESKCQEIKQKTGADVQFDTSPSDVQNPKILIIRGSLPQIEAAVRLINQETGAQETISAQAQTFWQQWTEAAFPDLDSRAYFLPPVYFNRVPMTTESAAGNEVLVLREAPGKCGQPTPRQAAQSNQPAMNSSVQPSFQDSDVRDDAAMQRFSFCLQKLSEENGEVLVGLSQLQFGQYLGEPCYAAAAVHLPVADSLPTALSKNQQGDFDVLLIHRQYGIVVCEVKAFGDNVGTLSMSQQDIDKNIRRKLKQALSQLHKAEIMLSHLVSDVTPGVRITKTIVVPNLTSRQVQQAVSGDPKLMQDLCRCLETTDPADITGLCVCSDHLSDPKTPWDVSSDIMRELGNWWQRRVAVSGPDSHMTCHHYKTLVARFCGPATTVTVPCTSPPRLCVKTLGQAVLWTGECYTAQITLFPEQVVLLSTGHPRVFVAGPPGTGKTVVLLLKATEWLRCGNDVYTVKTCNKSCAACSMIYHLLLQIVNKQMTSVVSPGQPHLLQYDFDRGKDVDKAVNDLSLVARSGSLYVITDEVYQDVRARNFFHAFCNKLLTQVPRLHLWAASCYHGNAPTEWRMEWLTRPLRFPPTVVREVQQDKLFIDDRTKGREIRPYSDRNVADHTDGPPVRRLFHRGQDHPGDWPAKCVRCCHEVTSFLQSLCVPVNSTPCTGVTTTNSSTTPRCIQWRDVLVLCGRDDVSDQSCVMTALAEAGIPVRVLKDGDIEDVVTAHSDVVWVAYGHDIRGLERKVVVCLEPDGHLPRVRFHFMSRCTSQLVIVSL